MIRKLSWTVALLLVGCTGEAGKAEKPVSRFESAGKPQAAKAAESFCEKSFPASGEGSRKWVSPGDRPLPAPGGRKGPDAARWTWVNLWASWCGPCVREMPLLDRWGTSLGRDGIPVKFEFWSVDESGDDLAKALKRAIPGEVRWLKDANDLPAVLQAMGVPDNSPIPVHALVDAQGQLRCVRVGSVGDEAFGAVKAMLAGG